MIETWYKRKFKGKGLGKTGRIRFRVLIRYFPCRRVTIAWRGKEKYLTGDVGRVSIANVRGVVAKRGCPGHKRVRKGRASRKYRGNSKERNPAIRKYPL